MNNTPENTQPIPDYTVSREEIIDILDSNWKLRIRFNAQGQVVGFIAEGPEFMPYWVEFIRYIEGGKEKTTILVFEKQDKNGLPNCGQVHLTLAQREGRKGKKGRYHVRVEKELVFVDPTHALDNYRAARNSATNPIKAVKPKHIPTYNLGDAYLNTRRGGGLPVNFLGTLAGWSPEYADQMMDIAHFVRAKDGPGLIALAKLISEAPISKAFEIVRQMHSPEQAEVYSQSQFVDDVAASLDEEGRKALLVKLAQGMDARTLAEVLGAK